MKLVSKIKDNQFLSGILIAILGIVLFSSKAVMVKLAYKAFPIESINLLVLRMAFSLPFYLGVILFYKGEKPQQTSRKDFIYLVLFGFLGYYLASFLDFWGLKYIKASLERVILFSYPTFVLIFNILLFKTKVSKLQIFATFLTYIGIFIAFWNEVELNEDVYFGGFLIVLCAITYALYISGSGWLIPKFGTIKFTAYAMTFACLGVFIHFALLGEAQFGSYPTEIYVLSFFIAIIATVIPSFLVSEGIKRIDSSNFSVIAGLGPISTIILAYFFLGEQLNIYQWLGTLIVIFGILVIAKQKT